MSSVGRPGAVHKNGQSPASRRGAPRSMGASATAAAAAATAAAKKKPGAGNGPPNKSILSFFKKVPPPEESLFVAGSAGVVEFMPRNLTSGKPQEPKREEEKENSIHKTANGGDEEPPRFNESILPVKRRRVSAEKKAARPAMRGPFLDDSDSDSNSEVGRDADGKAHAFADNERAAPGTCALLLEGLTTFDETFAKHGPAPLEAEAKAACSMASKDTEDFGEFADADFDELPDDFDGEEFRERQYMEEQARLEAEAIRDNGDVGVVGSGSEGATAASCPICGASLAGSTPDQATVHVNSCLDGGPSCKAPRTPAPAKPDCPVNQQTQMQTQSQTQTQTPVSALSKRFMRAAQPRPGQANPIDLGGGDRGNASGSAPSSGGPPGPAGSAFAKLMSGHAEDAAWATAAASESASRGRPAYERTCPFYKIMPGFFICVDAFRYGAVQGCRAYFLSHFHSDHYIGLTAKWCHGPIYCSAVTASLVRTQLGTAAKWVMALDFDTTVDVPGTEGVRVTMIPANHCPGSSMFLFEKTLPATQRTQRILHCGDFRACRAHVDHPLLAPGTLDTLAGTTRQQRIDVCYLDTTYLSPRYSFPPQDDVVAACADLCATLDRSLRTGQEGEWDKALHRRGGGVSDGSVKAYFRRTAPSVSKRENKSNEGNNGPSKGAESPANALSILGRRPPPPPTHDRNRLLVICGTYSIGKERICKAIAQAMNTKIFASPAKIKIVAQLGDPELTALMTPHATEAQVHMQMLMELRAETLAEYLDGYRDHFSRIVGLRPSGWNYRPAMANAAAAGDAAVAPASLSPSTLPTTTLLHGTGWRTRFGVGDLVPQRGSTREAMCFGVPYSEHSSFRELALFLMALHIDKVVPTVNVGSDMSRKRMKGWTDRWLAERRRGGLVRGLSSGDGDAGKLWDGKDGQGGGAYW